MKRIAILTTSGDTPALYDAKWMKPSRVNKRTRFLEPATAKPAE